MRFIWTVLAFLCLAMPALAETDEGLYDPVAPDGSAFVRVANASDTATDVKTGGKAFGRVKTGEVTKYLVIPQGQEVGGQKIEEKKYYTAVVTNSGFNLLTDTSSENRAKAVVALYNLGGADALSLKAQDGTIGVIEGVVPGQTGGRELNAVKVGFSVHKADGSKVA